VLEVITHFFIEIFITVPESDIGVAGDWNWFCNSRTEST